MGFLVRHDGVGPDARSLQRAVWQADPHMQFFAHQSPADIYARAAWQSRLVTILVAVFALLAVALALAGIYAVNSFLVARRTAEFGIRAALGATEHNLLRLVLGENLRLTALGIVAGAALAYAASRGLTALLYDVSGADPAAYCGATLAMFAACTLAATLPARRAARVSPVIALREG
jgi:putative ABC transport system permease protein